jgi:hypothetical protein
MTLTIWLIERQEANPNYTQLLPSATKASLQKASGLTT